jgi:hypothetical protein
MAEASNTILETGDGIASSAPSQPCKNNNGKKLAWFDRRMKLKFTLVGIILVTIAFYVVLIFGVSADYFTYYAGAIALLISGLNFADAANTYSQSRYLGNSPNFPSKFEQPEVTPYAN